MVDHDDKVGYEPTFDATLDGRGTGTLVMRGAPLSIHVSALTSRTYLLPG